MPTPTPTVEVNWSAFAGAMTNVLRSELVDVLEGSQADIENFLLTISTDLTRAMREGNDALTDEIRNQAAAVLELNRLRVAGAQKRIFDTALGLVLGIGSALLGNVVGIAVSSLVRPPTTPRT